MKEFKYNIKRYDLSEDKSLRAWSSADEYLLQSINSLDIKPIHLGIYNDRFGFLNCYLNTISSTTIITHKSQEKTIETNLKANNLPIPNFSNPLTDIEIKIDLAIIKVPKSLGLFRLFLEQIVHNSSQDIRVICSFMTRYFSPKVLEIAGEYFEVVEQSKALKKSRLLILSNKKETAKQSLISSLIYNNQEYKQYLGVFSAGHIDYATQFFLEHIEVKETDKCVLDLASGNGIIANEVYKQLPEAEIHLMDDSFVAVSSAKLNIKGENIIHHFNNELSIFDDNTFDLIVTNPPFHFEYEINIQIPLELFKGCYRCLKIGGSLQIVANKHLNYKIHLEPIFKSVTVIAEDKKFIVYKCIK